MTQIGERRRILEVPSPIERTGMIVWYTVIPYAKDPDRRFG